MEKIDYVICIFYLYLNKVIHEFTFYTLHEYCSGTFRTVSRLFREVVHLLLMILVLLDTLLLIYTTIQLYNKGRVLVGLVSGGKNECCNKHCYTYQDSLQDSLCKNRIFTREHLYLYKIFIYYISNQ